MSSGMKEFRRASFESALIFFHRLVYVDKLSVSAKQTSGGYDLGRECGDQRPRAGLKNERPSSPSSSICRTSLRN